MANVSQTTCLCYRRREPLLYFDKSYHASEAQLLLLQGNSQHLRVLSAFHGTNHAAVKRHCAAAAGLEDC
jgi:hypothetical protein